MRTKKWSAGATKSESFALIRAKKLQIPNLLPQQREGLLNFINQVLVLPLKFQSKFPLLDPVVFAYEFFW